MEVFHRVKTVYNKQLNFDLEFLDHAGVPTSQQDYCYIQNINLNIKSFKVYDRSV